MQQVTIYGVTFDMVGKQPIVLPKTPERDRYLPIWIGHPEAAAILMKLQGAPTPRPMTHDLVTEMRGELNATVAKISLALGARGSAKLQSLELVDIDTLLGVLDS